MNTSEIEIGKKHLTLMKGQPGCGKSIAAHSYPGPSYTFDFDEKMDAVAAAYSKRDFEYGQFDDIFQPLSKLTELKKHCPYKTIIWDGWSPFARLALQSVLGIRAPGKKRITVGNIERYQIEDYGS